MAVIYRACYCTREEARRALDLRQAAYANDQIDRAIMSASEAVEAMTQRRFYVEDDTRTFDWPNQQYAPPWKLYLEENELADIPTAVVSGSLLSIPVNIPLQNVIFQPNNTGPPFTRLELRRDLNSTFGNNPTPQQDIAITGSYGYWTKKHAAGTITAAVLTTTETTITVSNSALVSAGDVITIGTERMIVQDAQYVDTTVAYSGLSQASAADRDVQVADSTKFAPGEVLLVDAEWMLIDAIQGSHLIVRRGWDGSLLAQHSGGTLWARRVLTVLRGALGTTTATHTATTALAVADVPGLVKELAIAEAVVLLTQEHGGYGGASAPNNDDGGAGLPDLRYRVCNSRFARAARVRAI